ncbi:EAL domain-containing protein [Oxynema aestuarii]|jgi:diguanylate cyclase (GGDEF)-like protein|uniref:EAL domain-containing protein n=1 Tax=Oxynema aestuarii AP17 TaxID=2064643 RepID=A0A6H1TWV3_9CYAN|nr:EAL domain-containing protein [Oxynema aestuarii]QIZ71074.1 EAL domain-containing protein [Oxynema aestuarii AP17]RMH77906.1 MAG: EAL domain-containing protein [Cyanobacteria bacterium J007]
MIGNAMGDLFKRQIWAWRGVWMTAPIVATLTIALRLSGVLQLLEWAALDRLFRMRPPEPIDPRIAIVEITESDIRQAQQWPISDAALTVLLEKIKKQQPRAIGLDLYRDLPVEPGHAQLVELFENTPNLIGIEKAIGDNYGAVVAAPPKLKELDRVGAVDLLLDGDGKVRRALLSVRPNNQGQTVYTLGVRLALMYLEGEGIQLETVEGDREKVRLGKALFDRWQPNSGGYVRANTGGYQILYNFRSLACRGRIEACEIFLTVSMNDLLEERIPRDLLRDRIVLIGSTAPSLKDRFFTPYSTNYITALPGVKMHGDLASQILSAALDGRPLIRTWNEAIESLWIFAWAAIGATLAWSLLRRRWEFLTVVFAACGLVAIAYFAFLRGWWIPLVPPLLSLGGSYISIVSYIAYTERRRSEAQLRYHALHDALTGLPNRFCFLERLQEAIAHSQVHCDYRFAVLFLDLDRFKLVNDALGHRTGDELLVALGDRLQTILASQDTIARLGGDEFIILLDNIHQLGDALAIVDRIYEQLQLPFNLNNGYQVYTSASIGILINDADYQEPEDFLGAADVAMYRAKARGKGCYEIFDASMQGDLKKLLQLENDLRHGIDRAEFVLYYQPIVCLKTNTVTGFEALVRWQHPERGFISPAQFIPVAEETGLIVPLGWWILYAACEQIARWQAQFPDDEPLKISVNLSGRQFLQADLVEQIERIIKQTGLATQGLKLEITESVVMQNAETAVKMLERLKTLGIQLSVDDFGTGYSSLSYLRRFPVDTLKIDRSFIHEIDTNSEQLEIVRTIVLMAHSLGMDAIAEGVENARQLKILRDLDCDYVQGYLFSKPVNSEMAETFLMRKLNAY